MNSTRNNSTGSEYALRLALFLGVLGSALICCVSKTIHDERFQDSQLLTAPANSVVIGDPENYAFGVVGDLHVGGANTALFERILTGSAAVTNAFMVLLGDLADQGERQDFLAVQSAISTLGFAGTIFPALGNHDIFNDGWTPYKEIMGPSHYTFTVGNAKFIVVDTGDGSLGEKQMEWFEAELKKSRPRHLFVASHYLPIVPNEGNTPLKVSDDYEAMKLMKLAKTHSVSAWFGGHFHGFAEGVVGGVHYVCAGGGGGRFIGNPKHHFFVKVSVAGQNLSFDPVKVE